MIFITEIIKKHMNNKRPISKEDIINKAVRDSIEEFLKSLGATSAVSPRIDDEIPDVSKYVRTFGNINSFDEDNPTINEGLIKTYPIDKSINYIVRKYGLSSNQVQVNSMNNGIIPVDIICVILPNGIDGNTLGNIKHDLQTCGYFNNQEPTSIQNTNYFVLAFEPKFSKDISKMVRQNYKYLYHSTPRIYMDKIVKLGLIPKSKNSLFFYPDRTFLMIGDKLDPKQINVLKNVQSARNAHVDPNNPIETKEYVLLTIDVSRLPTDIKFYCDPMADGAIFTYDNVPPNTIVGAEPFTL